MKEIEKERLREERKSETDRISSIARVVPTGHRPIDCMQVSFLTIIVSLDLGERERGTHTKRHNKEKDNCKINRQRDQERERERVAQRGQKENKRRRKAARGCVRESMRVQ